jgi:hypothetical protein
MNVSETPDATLNMLPPLQDAKLSEESGTKLVTHISAPVIETQPQPASITPNATSEPILQISNGRLVDDIPPTPKKPISILDPRRYEFFPINSLTHF